MDYSKRCCKSYSCNTCDYKDYGKEPYVFDIQRQTRRNNCFRKTIWTGDNLQLTLMSINPGDDIGLESHPDIDQFIRIEQGCGLVEMGECKDNLDYKKRACAGDGVLIPKGTWHNLTNIGNIPLKLYSIYAPPEHAPGTVHKTKCDAEHDHHH